MREEWIFPTPETPAEYTTRVATERHHRIMITGLQSNLLVALQRAIEDDPSIPSYWSTITEIQAQDMVADGYDYTKIDWDAVQGW